MGKFGNWLIWKFACRPMAEKLVNLEICLSVFGGADCGLQIDGFNVEVLKSQSLKISIKFTVRSGNMIELTSVAPS